MLKQFFKVSLNKIKTKTIKIRTDRRQCATVFTVVHRISTSHIVGMCNKKITRSYIRELLLNRTPSNQEVKKVKGFIDRFLLAEKSREMKALSNGHIHLSIDDILIFQIIILHFITKRGTCFRPTSKLRSLSNKKNSSYQCS